MTDLLQPDRNERKLPSEEAHIKYLRRNVVYVAYTNVAKFTLAYATDKEAPVGEYDTTQEVPVSYTKVFEKVSEPVKIDELPLRENDSQAGGMLTVEQIQAELDKIFLDKESS